MLKKHHLCNLPVVEPHFISQPRRDTYTILLKYKKRCSAATTCRLKCCVVNYVFFIFFQRNAVVLTAVVLAIESLNVPSLKQCKTSKLAISVVGITWHQGQLTGKIMVIAIHPSPPLFLYLRRLTHNNEFFCIYQKFH